MSLNDDDLKLRVEAVLWQRVARLYHPNGVPVSLAQRLKNGKLPLENTSDTGAAFEWFIFYNGNSDVLPPFPLASSEQTVTNKDAVLDNLAREEQREAAWLAAGQHGFAALAGLPELQALLQHCCAFAMDAIDVSIRTRVDSSDDDLYKRMCEEEKNLLSCLAPQLQLCLLADVAAGLLVPGHPLPPDTPEHGAALQHFLKVAEEQLIIELSRVKHHDNLSLVLLNDYQMFLNSQRSLQLAVPGHQLLELLCQLMDSARDSQQQQSGSSTECGSSSSSGGAGVGGSSGGMSASKTEQLQAMRSLLKQSQPALLHCPQLMQRLGSGSSSSSSGSVSGSDVLQGCFEAIAKLLRDQNVPWSVSFQDMDLDFSSDLAAAVLTLAAVGGEALVAQQQQQQQQQKESEVEQTSGVSQPGKVLAEQLRVLGGGLVLQFVSAARAAGGPAWQQEVPLQAVLLLGALEQLQGLALAAVQQDDVQEACAAAAADAASSSSKPNNIVEDGQQQAPAERLQLLVEKVIDIINLTRQFAQLNAALNSKGGSSITPAATSGSSSTVPPLSCGELFSPGGPVHALYHEPATLGGWLQPAATASAGTSKSSIGSVACGGARSAVLGKMFKFGGGADSPKQPVPQHQQQQQQQLYTDALAGALLLFRVQELALREPVKKLLHCRLADWYSELDPRPDNASQFYAWKAVADRVREAAQEQNSQLGHISTRALLPALCLGRQRLEQLRQHLEQQLQQQGIDPSWSTLHNVASGAAAADAASNWGSDSESDDSSEDDEKQGSWLGGRLGSSWKAQQQAGIFVAAAVKAGGRSIRILQEQFRVTAQQPAVAFLQQWLQEALQLLKEASNWWDDPNARTNWMQQQQEQPQPQPAAAATAGTTMLGSMGNWLSRAGHWATSSTPDGEQQDGLAGSCSSPADGQASGSSSSGGCPLCNREALELAAAAKADHTPAANSAEGCSSAAAASNAAAGSAGEGSAAADTGVRAACSPSSACSSQQFALDPFAWRRLLWALFGKLRPSAAAWYVQHYGMCPHCPCADLWAMVVRSMHSYLWVPPDAEQVQWQLSAPPPVIHFGSCRERQLLQYARALNEVFLKGERSQIEAAALLSHQVLLSLSPAHQQLQPACEVVSLCPSSFVPAVNKLLQQQLGMAHLLQREVVKAGQPLMWHVWWHVGVRRYHWVKHQQQGQQQDAQQSQQQQAGLQPLSSGQLAALYADPAARYYAAGFAARQTAAYGTGMRARAAVRAPHTVGCSVVTNALIQGRLQVLAQTLPGSDSSDAESHVQQLVQLGRIVSQALQDAAKQGQMHLTASSIFPPLFRPEGQVGKLTTSRRSEGLGMEMALLNRPGEALHLTDSNYFAGPLATECGERLQRVMQRCDTCRVQLQQLDGKADARRSSGGGWLSCPCCAVPRYCSAQCQMKDEPHHAQLCSLLTAAQQRYAGPQGSAKAGSIQQLSSAAAGAVSVCHKWRAWQLLQPEAGPLGMDCQAFAKRAEL